MQEGNRIIGTEITEWPWGLMRHSGFNCAIHSAVSGSNLKQTIYPFSEFNGFIRSRLLEICLLNFSLSLENEKKIKESWNSNFKAPVLSLLLLRPSFSSLSGGAKKRSPNQACPYRISHLIQFKSLERISGVGDHWADSTKFVRLSRFLNLQAGLF